MLVKVKLYNQIMDLRPSTAECILQYGTSYNRKAFLARSEFFRCTPE
jgi:hypothetical protein